MIRLHHPGLAFQPQRTLNRVTKQRHDALSHGLPMQLHRSTCQTHASTFTAAQVA